MDILKLIAESNNWSAIVPETMLAVLALLLLLAEIGLPKCKSCWIPKIAMGGILLTLIYIIIFSDAFSEAPMQAFNGMVNITPLGEVMRVFFLLSAFLVGYIATIYFQKHNLPQTEFFHLLVVATMGLMILSKSNHFILLFVSLELVSVAFYILISYSRTSQYSLEAGIKYLILSGLSTAILLFGIVLLYGAAGNISLEGSTINPLNFNELANFISLNYTNLFVQVGVVLVVCGVAFKIGGFPFQIWIPDVYQGAPTPVMAFLAVASKAGGLILLINLMAGPFMAMQYLLIPVLSAMAAISILFGNIAAVPQCNVKRLIGLSGVAHAGYMLIGVIAAYKVSWAIPVVIFYLYAYLLATFAVSSVMALVSGVEDDNQLLEHYENLAKANPFLGFVLATGLVSLAGIPPTAGFIGKLLIFIAAYKAGLYGLLGVAVIGVVISIYYYFDWIREAFFFSWKGKDDRETVEKQLPVFHLPGVHRFMLGLLSSLTIALGLYQGYIGAILFIGEL